jgi:hypothetical protein
MKGCDADMNNMYIKDSKDTKHNKDTKDKFNQDSTPYKLSALLLLKIKEHLPNFKTPDLQNWSTSMDRLIRLDERHPEEIREVILFAQADPFWCQNILSVDNLRKNYDRLNMNRIKQVEKSAKADDRKGKNDWRIESDEYEHFFR